MIDLTTTIYLDVLFFVNLIINYLCLAGAVIFIHRDYRRRRLLLGATLGALYSVFMFFPEFSFFFSAFLKLLFSGLIILVSFKFKSTLAYLKTLFSFYIVSIIFGGGLFLIYFFTSAGNIMNYSNGVWYIDMPLWLILLSVFAFYGMLKLFSRLYYAKSEKSSYCKVKIEAFGGETEVSGLIDTGNSLYDPITCLPVMVVEYDKIKKILPALLCETIKNGDLDRINEEEFIKNGFRIIPYKGLGDTGTLIYAFKPKRVTIIGRDKQTRNILIGITSSKLSGDERFNAILHSSMA